MSAKMDRRSFMRLAAFYPAFALLPVPCQAEDGQASLPAGAAGQPIVLSGEYGDKQQSMRNLPAGAIIDARDASFIVATRRNGDPSPPTGRKGGPLPANR